MARRFEGASLDGVTTDFTPGVVLEVAACVRRIVAPNASMMTGPGTNTYLIGDPVIAIVDPGPADSDHIESIAAIAARARCVLVTHTHADHSPAAAYLAQRLGAQLIGRAAPADGRQDLSFVPSVQPQRNERFQLDGLTLVAIDTPGHASNHVCYLLEQTGLLFSGDHLLEGVTPVILSPDGDMAAYMDSLERLKEYSLRHIAPGHGRVFAQPMLAIDAVIAHRQHREAQVLAALRENGNVDTDFLLPIVYSDVLPELLPYARCSLEAHLIKLQHDGVCTRSGDVWCAYA
ncbi:MAG: MBL fold metallo-hydrolase [Pseudomonadales bacterium]|nr:MBL fold metallo-hydrolase [Pseudomonadales bacterium]